MRGTMMFFYRTPLARLVSVFSADQERIDDLMPDSLLQVLQYVPLLLATMILIAINLAWTCFPAVALIVFTVLIARATNDAIGAIKDQEAISRPHALTHVTATTQGLQTIRAMCVERRFVETFESRLDRSHNFWNCLFHAQLWQAMQLDLLTAVYVFVVCCLSVYFSSLPLSVTRITPRYVPRHTIRRASMVVATWSGQRPRPHAKQHTDTDLKRVALLLARWAWSCPRPCKRWCLWAGPPARSRKRATASPR